MNPNFQPDSPFHPSLPSPGGLAFIGQQQQQQQHLQQLQQQNVSHHMNPRQGGHPQYTQENGIAMQPSYNALSIGMRSPAPSNIGGHSHLNYGAGTNLKKFFCSGQHFHPRRWCCHSFKQPGV